MLRLELAQSITESFVDVISEMEAVRTAIINKRDFYVAKTTDFGGSRDDIDYRFRVLGDSVSFKLVHSTFVYIIYLYFDVSTECTIVYTDNLNIQLECGKKNDTSAIRLIDKNDHGSSERLLTYPVQEEQYFQYSTLHDLAPVSFYDKMMNYSTDYLSGIHLNYVNSHEGETDIQNLLSDSKLIHSITNAIRLVISAYRTTNKI